MPYLRPLLAPVALLLACATAPAPRLAPAAAAPGAVAAAPPAPEPVAATRPGASTAPEPGPAVEPPASAVRAGGPEPRFRRVLALEAEGRAAEAVAELEALRREAPEDALVRGFLAERYESAGRLRDAERELRRLAELGGGQPASWRRLAAFCRRHEFVECAEASTARAREAEVRPRRVLRPLLPSRL